MAPPLVAPPAMSGAALTKDATNRAARTAYIQLGIDVLVAVSMLLSTVVNDASDWDEFNWKVLGFSLAKTIVATIGAFILRRFMDASSVPTPLPPAPVPAPNELQPEKPAETDTELPYVPDPDPKEEPVVTVNDPDTSSTGGVLNFEYDEPDLPTTGPGIDQEPELDDEGEPIAELPEPELTLHVEDPDIGAYEGTLPDELDVPSPDDPDAPDNTFGDEPVVAERSLQVMEPYETPERSMADKAGE